MTVNSGKSTNKKERSSTKLKPGSFRDNMPEPFHTTAAVNGLFKMVAVREKELAAEKASSH